MIQKVLKLYSLLQLKLKEKKFNNRLKYVYCKTNSDTLIIVFSAFASHPRYNYMRALRHKNNVSKLFILDDFGYKGSYYWFEGGKDSPLTLTKGLIESIIKEGHYNNVLTMGTSKGGTCAIYYGLMFQAKDIYAGACQYYVGNYLNTPSHMPIMEAMMGRTVTYQDVELLNRKMPEQLKTYKESSSIVHLLYSKRENTYQEHILPLIRDLKDNHIAYREIVEDFENHNDVGKFFIPYIQHEIVS